MQRIQLNGYNVLSFIKNYFKPAQDIFTWKYIDVDNDLVEEIRDIYLKNLKENLSQYNFFQVLPICIPNVMGKEVIGAGLVYSSGNHKSSYAHKDPIVKDLSTFALNIPLVNCQDSLTTLYKSRKAPMYNFNSYGITEIAKLSNCDAVTSYTLDKPILFNTQVLHAVDNLSPDPRLAISLRFTSNPVEWL